MGRSTFRIAPYTPNISRRWSSLTFFVSFSITIYEPLAAFQDLNIQANDYFGASWYEWTSAAEATAIASASMVSSSVSITTASGHTYRLTSAPIVPCQDTILPATIGKWCDARSPWFWRRARRYSTTRSCSRPRRGLRFGKGGGLLAWP